ncbi:hypothetical protein [Pedobacter sp. SYSU D00535]|uniref:hypothetical protein n=1 Tax=Pedobacter sp. SYSU D00535 TaxID=2810308 RepID=UPI001A96F453|nr:hypothetical protein [Pedobacter sp. SYSU D00535]
MLSHNYRLKKEQYPATIAAGLARDYSRPGMVTYEVDLDGKPDYKLVLLSAK